MAIEKLKVKDLQKRKSESVMQVLSALSRSYEQGTLRKLADPRPIS